MRITFLGFSFTGYGDGTSYGQLLKKKAAAEGLEYSVEEVSYGGLSVNALACIMPLACHNVRKGDVVGLEIATSFFSQQKYTYQQALPLVSEIASYLLAQGVGVFFLNLYRPDLDDDDCVVQAIKTVAQEKRLEILDLKRLFRAREEGGRPYAVNDDGVHPSEFGRSVIAEEVLSLLKRAGGIVPDLVDYEPGYGFLSAADLLPNTELYEYEGRGKKMMAAVIDAPANVKIHLGGRRNLVGYFFLYGPETGFVEIESNGKRQELITFDEHSYYRRVGFRPFFSEADSVALHVPERRRAVSMQRSTSLAVRGRCEYFCGFGFQAR